MGATKELFMQTRELEQIQYSADFTKKEAIAQGKIMAKDILDRGEVTPVNALSNIARLKEFINALESELRSNIIITEKHTENGVEFSLRNTGDRLDYEADEIYKELSDKLKDRTELLKTSFKSKDTIYDGEGVEIPKVPIKSVGKQVINLKF
jgi:chromatin segregation and condensation protein Rec8/ScpA/Scc1 (kleisin family)